MIQEPGMRAASSGREPIPEHVETELIDLTEISFAELRNYDAADLAPSLDRVMRQIEQPRANLGGSAPPGRVD